MAQLRPVLLGLHPHKGRRAANETLNRIQFCIRFRVSVPAPSALVWVQPKKDKWAGATPCSDYARKLFTSTELTVAHTTGFISAPWLIRTRYAHFSRGVLESPPPLLCSLLHPCAPRSTLALHETGGGATVVVYAAACSCCPVAQGIEEGGGRRPFMHARPLPVRLAWRRRHVFLL